MPSRLRFALPFQLFLSGRDPTLESTANPAVFKASLSKATSALDSADRLRLKKAAAYLMIAHFDPTGPRSDAEAALSIGFMECDVGSHAVELGPGAGRLAATVEAWEKNYPDRPFEEPREQLARLAAWTKLEDRTRRLKKMAAEIAGAEKKIATEARALQSLTLTAGGYTGDTGKYQHLRHTRGRVILRHREQGRRADLRDYDQGLMAPAGRDTICRGRRGPMLN